MTTAPFHELLKKYRYDSGFTQVDLAKALENHQPVISNFERGRALPSRDEVLAISKVLNLDETQTNDLLVAAKYPPIADSISLGTKIENVVIHDLFPPANPSYRELNIQIQDLKDAITNISEHLATNGTTNAAKSSLQSENLLTQVQDMQATIAELQATSKDLTAPVALPSRQKLEVKLIPITSFERIEEYRAEENKWFTWFGVFFGAMLGVFINLITGGQATISTWIVSGTFIVMASITGLSAKNYSQRALKLRNELRDEKTTSQQTSNTNNAG